MSVKYHVVIDRQIAMQRQGVQLLEHLKASNGDKLRIDIYSDAYKHQSHARLFRWNGSEWVLFADRPIGAMETKESLCYLPDRQTRNYIDDFAADREWLLKIFDAIVPKND